MLKEERFRIILEKLSKDQKVTLKTLSKQLKISEYTVRRDLKELTDQGLLKAVRGGAIPHSPLRTILLIAWSIKRMQKKSSPKKR